jgi:phosphoglycerate dehydrogenase-like enzyme
VGNDAAKLAEVFGRGRRQRLAQLTELYGPTVGEADFEKHCDALERVQVLFATWGLDPGLARRIAGLPRLEAVFYAAGSVRAFAAPLLERNVVLVSAAHANAVPVAQFTVSQALLALKGYFRNLRARRAWRSRGAWIRHEAPGVFREPVALLGCGAVGSLVARHLRHFGVPVLAFDDRLGGERARELGVEPVGLEEAFARALVVSNHLPDLPGTVGLLRREHFARLRRHATFINTGRGSTVDEPGLIAVLKARPDLCALLDVTWPEPPPRRSPLYRLENVHLSSHIAGCIGDETSRLADACLEELERFLRGEALEHRVTPDMLERMA